MAGCRSLRCSGVGRRRKRIGIGKGPVVHRHQGVRAVVDSRGCSFDLDLVAGSPHRIRRGAENQRRRGGGAGQRADAVSGESTEIRRRYIGVVEGRARE